MKITLLGTGTPAPSLERQSSGYLFEVGGASLEVRSFFEIVSRSRPSAEV